MSRSWLSKPDSLSALTREQLLLLQSLSRPKNSSEPSLPLREGKAVASSAGARHRAVSHHKAAYSLRTHHARLLLCHWLFAPVGLLPCFSSYWFKSFPLLRSQAHLLLQEAYLPPSCLVLLMASTVHRVH